MITQYITFGQVHTHPETNKPMKNHVVKVQAPNKHLARAAAFARFGDKFSFINDSFQESYYPYGVYETLIVSLDVFKGDRAHELVADHEKLVAQHYNEYHEEPEPEEEPKTPGEEQDDEPKTPGEKDREYLKGESDG